MRQQFKVLSGRKRRAGQRLQEVALFNETGLPLSFVGETAGLTFEAQTTDATPFDIELGVLDVGEAWLMDLLTVIRARVDVVVPVEYDYLSAQNGPLVISNIDGNVESINDPGLSSEAWVHYSLTEDGRLVLTFTGADGETWNYAAKARFVRVSVL